MVGEPRCLPRRCAAVPIRVERLTASNAGESAMTALAQDRIEASLRIAPSPIVDLVEDERWHQIGAVRLSKAHARFCIGFPHPLAETTHFAVQHFEAENKSGWAVILQGAPTVPAYFAGWVAEPDHGKAVAWVERLNSEIQHRVTEAKRE